MVRTKAGVEIHYPLNYCANLGTWFVYDPVTRKGGRGAFFPDSKLTFGSFTDGLSNTLCFAEVKAWNPYFRNAALPSPLAMPTSAADLISLAGQFKISSGHTEWVDGRAHQTGFTTLFTPNTEVFYELDGRIHDVDWTNQQEGKSDTVATYAAVTARSYHVRGVQTVFMDGSVHFVNNDIKIKVWRILSTRNGQEINIY